MTTLMGHFTGRRSCSVMTAASLFEFDLALHPNESKREDGGNVRDVTTQVLKMLGTFLITADNGMLCLLQIRQKPEKRAPLGLLCMVHVKPDMRFPVSRNPLN